MNKLGTIRIHYLQHIPFENLASIAEWARQRGHQVSQTRLFQQDPFPKLDTVDWVIILGGSMSTRDEGEYSWLVEEKQFIRQAINQRKVVLGICLGAQLVAEVLGARVYPNTHKEIGWFPIEFTEAAHHSPLFSFLPRRMDVFHWHEDTFDLPPGTTHLAWSEGCRNQAFIYGEQVIGLQFHIEMTLENVKTLIAHCAEELEESAPYIQQAEQITSRTHTFVQTNEAMYELLDRMEQVFFAQKEKKT
jgi:GMP synthase-like glutamine amidotransferase